FFSSFLSPSFFLSFLQPVSMAGVATRPSITNKASSLRNTEAPSFQKTGNHKDAHAVSAEAFQHNVRDAPLEVVFPENSKLAPRAIRQLRLASRNASFNSWSKNPGNGRPNGLSWRACCEDFRKRLGETKPFGFFFGKFRE